MRIRLPSVRVGEDHAPVRDDKKRLASRLWWLPAWVFAAVTIAPALLAVAWLVPGTGMLLAGRLLPLPMAIIFGPLAVALCYFAMRRLPASWPRTGSVDQDASGEGGTRAGVPAAAVAAAVVIAAGFGVWQAALRSSPVFVTTSPGTYLQYGYWIAVHGTTRIPASPAAFGGIPGLDFATAGFFVTGSTITPAYLPGLPLVVAAGSWLGGLSGALLMPAVLGGCAVLSFGGLVGRLCGAWWAVAGELVLAVCLPEVYTTRTPFAEPLVQVLLFGGLCLFTDSLVVRKRGLGAAGYGSGDGLVLAGLGGFALGLTVLASVASLGTLLPAFPVLALLFAARRPQAAPFGAGLILGIATGLLAGLVLARPYLSTLSPQLHLIGLCAAGFGVATALMAPLAFPGVRAWIRRVCAVQPRFKWFGGEQLVLPSIGFLLAGLALVLPVLVLGFLAARPYLQITRGQTDPAVIRHVELLQRLEKLPVDGRRQYYEWSLYWVFWYIGVPAALLACAGAAVLGRRTVRSVLPVPTAGGSSGTSDGAAAGPLVPAAGPGPDLAADSAPDLVPDSTPALTPDLAPDLAPDPPPVQAGLALWVLPFLIIAWSVGTVLWDPAVVPWQPLASHRLVPVVLPGLLLLALWVSSRLTSRASLLGASRPAVVLVAACCVLALAIPPLVTTFNPSLAAKPAVGRNSSGLAKFISRVQFRGVGASATGSGSLTAAAALCAAIGQSATVLFVNEKTAQSYAPVVRDQCGQPVAALVPAAKSAAQLQQAMTSIARTGRRPVLLGPTRASVTLPGAAIRHAVSLRTTADAEVLTGPPAGNWPVRYSLWLSVADGFGG